MQNSNEVALRCQQVNCSPTSKYHSLRDTGNNNVYMGFDGELAVKLHDKDVEVGTIL